MIFCFPAIILAILIDTMRKLRLLHDTLQSEDRQAKSNTWCDLKDRILFLCFALEKTLPTQKNAGLVYWMLGVKDLLGLILCCKKGEQKDKKLSGKNKGAPKAK